MGKPTKKTGKGMQSTIDHGLDSLNSTVLDPIFTFCESVVTNKPLKLISRQEKGSIRVKNGSVCV